MENNNNLDLIRNTTSPDLLDILYVNGTLEEQIEIIRNPHVAFTTLLRAANSDSNPLAEYLAKETLRKECPQYMFQFFQR